MSTTNAPAQVPRSQGQTEKKLSTVGVLLSEQVKFWSFRSTWWCLGIFMVVQVGLCALTAPSLTSVAVQGLPPLALTQDGASASAATFVVLGARTDVFVIAILGVLAIGGEYGSGQIRSTLIAVPKRLPVLWAKSVVLAGNVFVVAFVAFLISFLPVSLILSADSLKVSLFASDVIGPFLGASAYLALISVFALGVGVCLRSSVAGISTALGILLVIPTVFAIIKTNWADAAINLLPTTGAGIFGQGSLNPWLSAVILVGWVGLSLLAAAISLRNRDL
jgi:ABC-2 type transport system permease protein